MKGGAKTWYFADGYLPEKVNNGQMEAHEALMLFNAGNRKAKVNLDVYFADREPIKGIKILVDAERVKTLRLDVPGDLSGAVIPPVTQYSLRVRSSSPLVAQFGRLDTTQNAMAYYVGIGFSE
jgi:hypothetical protein